MTNLEPEAELRLYLANPGSFPDPYPLFKRIRDIDPMYWSDAGTWIVLGHAEAREVYRHPALSTAAGAAAIAARFGVSTDVGRDAISTYLSWFINMDEPGHTRLRALVSHAFRPDAVKQWDAVIAQTVDDVLTTLEGQESFDFLYEFAYVIPSKVICDILGVPYDAHKLFEDWTSRWNNNNMSDPTARRAESPTAPLEEFVAYLRELVSERRKSADSPDDLASMLIQAEEDGDRLSEHELIAALMLLIIAGHDTTANLIDNGMYALLTHPDQYALLQRDPALLGFAIEEFFRFDGPARSQPRVALRDAEICGHLIKEGQPIQVHLGAVNHDGRTFERPEEFDITRTNNPHMGFGHGAHYCLGRHVARLEAQHAFEGILGRMGPVELAGEVQWRNGHLRGLTSLPVRRI